MRKFFIENETGSRYALNGEQRIWFTEPQGLGVSVENMFGTVGSGFFTPVYQEIQQNSVTGNITFLRDVYPAYAEFVTWLLRSKTLYFVYQPTDTEYMAQVRLEWLTKSEINRGRWLQVPASFVRTTPWYNPVPVSFEIVPVSADAMRYPWRYNIAVYAASAAGNMAAVINADGHIPASFVLTYTGEIQSPVLRLDGQSSGDNYGRIAINRNLAAGDTLEISTRYLDSYIRSALQGDLLQYVDVSVDPYPHIPITEPIILSLSANNAIENTISLTVNNYYQSV